MNSAAINRELTALARQRNDEDATASFQTDADDLNFVSSDSTQSDFSEAPPQEELTGLVDPEKPTQNPDTVHETDLIIARNFRRLEIHRFEIANALKNLSDEEVGLVLTLEEDELELRDLDEQYATHVEHMNKLKKKKRKLDPDQKINQKLEQLAAIFTSNEASNADQTDPNKIESIQHSFRLAWHKWRFDNAIEARLFHPEKTLVETQDETSKISKEDSQAKDEAENKEHVTNEEQSLSIPLCAPTRLVSWSLDCIKALQEAESFRHFCFIDPKAGHGRTLLIAAKNDFRAIFGIETREILIDDTTMNIAQYPRSYMTQREIELITTEISPTIWPTHPLVIQIFNPTSEEWLSNLVADLNISYNDNPRQIYLILIGNQHKEAIENIGFLEEFTPETSQLDSLSLMSPYDIDFYFTDSPSQNTNN